MKKKIFGLSIIVLVFVLLICTFGRGIYFYVNYIVPNKDYFGEQYKELLHPMSLNDKKQAAEIMALIDEAFSFIGNGTDAENKFEGLSHYSITNEDAVSENHDLELITADFNETEGYLWFVYGHEALDKNNQIIRGSWDILVRITLEKTDQGWSVVNTKEHP